MTGRINSAHWWECDDCGRVGPSFTSEGSALANLEDHEVADHPAHEPEDA